jgi:probable selenium-dependent hydroxylase accessory protein YqeC
MTDSLLEVLGCRRGVVCAVGAGGKKTTLYRIAGAHPGRVGLTSTVFLAPFPASLDAQQVIAPQDLLVDRVSETAQRSRMVAFAHPSTKEGRLGGLSREEIATIQQRADFDVLLIKADGARMRFIKAPAEDEPVLPAHVDTVLYLLSARAFGAALDEKIAHRIELLERVTGARRGHALKTQHIARLLTSPDGALRSIGEARIVPIINMVDTPAALDLARETALAALSLTQRFSTVVLASMRLSDPIIDVISN